MSEHIYDALTSQRQDIREVDKRLTEMIGILIMKLMKKNILTGEEASEILSSTMLKEALKKEE